MTTDDIWNVAAAVVTAVGGGGVIVAALSGWLGKVWAEKLMVKEKARYDAELATFRSRIENENESKLAQLKHELDVFKETQMKGLSDKLNSYRQTIDFFAEACADILQTLKVGAINPSVVDVFHRRRMKAFGYLAMLASQEVLDRFAELSDYVEDVAESKIPFDIIELRKLTFEFVNAMRKDVGINPSEMKWRENYSLPYQRK